MTLLSSGWEQSVGDTPVVALTRLFSGAGTVLHAKLEFLNPGGSAKDRAAGRMVRDALQRGELRVGGHVIASTSGNMGIALAHVCRIYGLRLSCVVDAKLTRANEQLLRALGAELLRVEVGPGADPLMARLERVQREQRRDPSLWVADQYSSTSIAEAHRYETGPELVAALPRPPDVLLCAVSSCGMLAGLHDHLQDIRASTSLVAVDAVGSHLFGGQPGLRRIPGLGASVESPHMRSRAWPRVIRVTDAESVAGCHLLAEREGLLAGGSSGAVVAALWKLLDEIKVGGLCAAIFVDRGTAYLDNVFDERWVRQTVPDTPDILAQMRTARPGRTRP
jgi:2,3-diaminopropionate biosynthesis protein SbnA